MRKYLSKVSTAIDVVNLLKGKSLLKGFFFSERNILLSYIGWLLLVSISFVLMPKILLRNVSVDERLRLFMAIANINRAIAVIDILLCVLIIAISKIKVVKIVFAVYFVCKVLILFFISLIVNLFSSKKTPFRLFQQGISSKALTGNAENKIKYNGYEQNTSFDLNLYESFTVCMIRR